MKSRLLSIMGFVAAAGAALPLNAGLVAKWDFNNYDPANPTSTNVLAATVGDSGRCDVRLRQWRTEARTEGRWPLS